MNTLLISPSKLDVIQQCPELFRYLYVKELSGLSKPSYQEEGELFHYFLELYYKGKKDSIDFNIESIIELGRNKATTLNLTEEEIDLSIRLLKEYVLFYANESWKVEDVEVPFTVEIFKDVEADLRIVLEGKIDLLATEEKTGTPLVIDHKRVSANFTPFDRDNQKLAYCLATGRKDFIINRVGSQKTLTVDKRLVRFYFNYSQHQIDEFVSNTIDWALEILKVMKSDSEGSFVRRNYNACYRFNKPCMFYEVCNSVEDNKAYKLNEAFKPKTEFNLFGEK